jgi:hypothetical protein
LQRVLLGEGAHEGLGLSFAIRLRAASVTKHDTAANQAQPANHGRWTHASGVSSGVLARLPLVSDRSTTGHALMAMNTTTPDITIIENTSNKDRTKPPARLRSRSIRTCPNSSNVNDIPQEVASAMA